jgi:hypothetical protein
MCDRGCAVRQISNDNFAPATGFEAKSFVTQAFTELQQFCASIDYNSLIALSAHLKQACLDERRILIVGPPGMSDRSAGMIKSALSAQCGLVTDLVVFHTALSNLTEGDLSSFSSFTKDDDLIIFLRKPHVLSVEFKEQLSSRDLTIFALKSLQSEGSFFSGIIASFSSTLPDEAVLFIVVRSIVTEILGLSDVPGSRSRYI